MSKLTLLIVGLAVGALILGGAVEVKWHPEKVAHTPAVVKQYLSDKGTLQLATVQLTKLKRWVENAIASSADKKFELAVGYVETDSNKLSEQMESGDTPQTILLQAGLLKDSLNKLDLQLQDAGDKLPELQEKSAEAVRGAGETLTELKGLLAKYESYSKYLSQISGDISNTLQSIGLGQPEVAGTSDSPTPTPTTSGIPLRF